MNNNIILGILGTLAVGAYFLGNQDVKENFDGFQLSSVATKDMNIMSNDGKIESSVPFSMYPQLSGIQQKSVTLTPYNNVGLSKQSVTVPQMLGSSAVTSLPFVSMPSYQQSTPVVRPNVSLTSWQRVAPVSRSTMGMAPNCSDSGSCKGNIKEGFVSNLPKDDSTFLNDPDFPGVGYAAGNYNKMTGYQPCDDTTIVSKVQPMNYVNEFANSGDAQSETNVIVFDREMTTTKGTSTRTNRYSNVRDLIRGDIPIAPPVTTGSELFGYATTNPTDLNQGALTNLAMGSTDDHDTLVNFMKAYGKSNNTPQNPVPTMTEMARQGYQTIPQAMATREMSRIGGGDTSVVAFT